MKEPQRYIMPFGKFKGEYLGDIPQSYLLWLMENSDLRNPLKEAIEKTYEMLERS